MATIQFKRGMSANLPPEAEAGEVLVTLDTHEMWMGDGIALTGQPAIPLIGLKGRDNLIATVDPTVSNDETQRYSVGSKWINTTSNKYFVCTKNTTGAAVWVLAGAKDNLSATTDPTVSNDGTQGYSVGSKWINTTANKTFECMNISTGAAIWSLVGQKDNLSSAVDPTASSDGTQGYSVGSKWINTVLNKYFVCIGATTGAAVWVLAGTLNAPATPRGFVDGCRLNWVSTTQVEVQKGSINISGTTYEITSNLAITWTNIAAGSSKLASTWYYVYLKNVGGVLTPYISQAKPDRDSYGNAITNPALVKAKYHSTFGRFVGSFLTDASQLIVSFTVKGPSVLYTDLGFGYVLQAGAARSKTAVNCRAFVPYTADTALVYCEDLGAANASNYKSIGNNLDYSVRITSKTSIVASIQLTVDSVYYIAPNDSINIGIQGYYEEI